MKVIITGSTGMVGKGVLLECLENSHVKEVLIINRNSVAINHPKLKEILLKDFMQVKTLKAELKGYDTCFHCMGISAVGLSEEKYSEITYSMTKELVDVLYELNPKMTFNYVSGTGTDSSEKGRTMWARVKGKTENMILKKGFKDAYMFRPGAIVPEKGIKSRTGWYNAVYVVMRPFFGLMKKSKNITTSTRIGHAMIETVLRSGDLKILHNPDINQLALQHES
jgi:uncharacterized protein YbjT (DUF2867 family)